MTKEEVPYEEVRLNELEKKKEKARVIIAYKKIDPIERKVFSSFRVIRFPLC